MTTCALGWLRSHQTSCCAWVAWRWNTTGTCGTGWRLRPLAIVGFTPSPSLVRCSDWQLAATNCSGPGTAVLWLPLHVMLAERPSLAQVLGWRSDTRRKWWHSGALMGLLPSMEALLRALTVSCSTTALTPMTPMLSCVPPWGCTTPRSCAPSGLGGKTLAVSSTTSAASVAKAERTGGGVWVPCAPTPVPWRFVCVCVCYVMCYASGCVCLLWA